MTAGVTKRCPLHAKLIHGEARVAPMHCEFCAAPLPDAEPENLALLAHVQQSRPCHEQFDYLLENLRSSWTVNMSGG